MDRRDFEGPLSVVTADAKVMVADGRPPSLHEKYKQNAQLLEQIDLESNGRYLFVAVSLSDEPWPSLVVELRYEPCESGFDAGITTTQKHVFIGAGNRLLCYERTDGWRLLWTESVMMGFLGWSIHDGVVVMSAELGLAAWDARGRKLWSTFVEPPWAYRVAEDQVTLDVMGTISTFGLRSGPERPPAG